ncbi:Transcriptional regulator [Gaiella occulta]|uniref:Transcriptional regulator n=1 Tax=Gaiella occulta TaxID=1002870 RepID=A0A7M2Z1X8_9ACTN|nr:GntR family transcriptional regulator [Gaiella occulta]RDI76149.1 Transcriptional regulator [Gaiella occulta]
MFQPDADEAASLSERAAYRIRELIVSLELPPGAPVSERELMERLGFGRTPVREALRTLAQEKLVEVYPRRGIVVAPVDVGDLAALSEARIVLESFAARCAAERAAAEERTAARAFLAELPGAADEHDERTLIELDQRIHRHVYRCAHNPFIESTLNEYYILTLRIWFLALDRVPRLEHAVTEHRELLEAICDGDPRRAEDVMRRHIEGFERAIRAVL